MAGSPVPDSNMGGIQSALFESKLVLRLNSEIRSVKAKNKNLVKEVDTLRVMMRKLCEENEGLRTNTRGGDLESGTESGAAESKNGGARKKGTHIRNMKSSSRTRLTSNARSRSSGNLPGKKIMRAASASGTIEELLGRRTRSTSSMEKSIVRVDSQVIRFAGLTADVFDALQNRVTRRSSITDRSLLFFEQDSSSNVIFDRESVARASDDSDQGFSSGPAHLLIEAITLEKMISHLATFQHASTRLLPQGTYEPNTVDTFLISYRRYCTPLELLELVRLRWKCEPPSGQSDAFPSQEDARHALLHFVALWVERYMDDFGHCEQEVVELAKAFLREDAFKVDSTVGRRLLGRLWTIRRPLSTPTDSPKAITAAAMEQREAKAKARCTLLRMEENGGGSSGGEDSPESSRHGRKTLKLEKKQAKKLAKVDKKSKGKFKTKLGGIKTSNSGALPKLPSSSSSTSPGGDHKGGSAGSDAGHGSAAESLLTQDTVWLVDLPAAEIARQVVLMDQELFKRITWDELMNWGNGKGRNKTSMSPNVVAFVNRFNFWHNLVASELLAYCMCTFDCVCGGSLFFCVLFVFFFFFFFFFFFATYYPFPLTRQCFFAPSFFLFSFS
jgi:RasGEF domain/RasGEF N-terminal motif